MVRSTRSSYACARCYRRKKKCDRSYPSCSHCTNARAQCIGLDRGSEAELPRSLVSYLEELVAQLEVERDALIRDQASSTLISLGQPEEIYHAASSRRSEAPYRLVAATASDTAPTSSVHRGFPSTLPYHRVFFLGAELPFPLAFQSQRPLNLPFSPATTHFTQLPEEVAEKLVGVYVERILPQYPLFSKQEIIGIFQRYRQYDGGAVETVTADEHFIVSMILAIASLSSRARDYRKLVSLAESLRRDAFSRLDFGLRCNQATTTTMKQLLLLAQYGCLLPSSTNLWQVVGDATTIALELGLHQEVPWESGMDEAAIESRRRLYWALYAIERAVAITSHRPFAVAADQVHVPLPVSQEGSEVAEAEYGGETDQHLAHVPFIRLHDRVRYLRIQSEICSVNIGMRPFPSHLVTYRDWVSDIERRLGEVKSQAATPRWCALMEWQATLLLHMPCARNPNPEESSVLKYFDAALRIISTYWDLAESGNLDNPWHATHHCYEAGNLILYALWHHRSLVRRRYAIKQIFESVHQISGIFILLERQWPSAQQCGMLFDRLRKGALGFFKDEGSPDPDLTTILEARQLKDLLFRENAEILYAREQPSLATDDLAAETLFPDFDLDFLSLDNVSDFFGVFNFAEASGIDDSLTAFDPEVIGEPIELPTLPASPQTAIQSPTSPTTTLVAASDPAKPAIDTVQLKTAMQKLPICSHCKRRRTKCDMDLPACRNCTKTRRDCCYWDNALGQEVSRRHIHALYQHVESLMTEVESLPRLNPPMPGSSMIVAPAERRGSGSNGPPHRHGLANIFCPASSPYPADSTDCIFFGATSTFSRLATTLASGNSSLPLPQQENTSSAPRAPMLLETFCSSLVLDVKRDLCRGEAETLARYYYRSIEMTYPILGLGLISETLDMYNNSNDVSVLAGDRSTLVSRFNMILAISLAMLSLHDQRLQVVADTYLHSTISSESLYDLVTHPTNQSLQMMLLLCVYAWIRPSSLDIWRLLGHASRMCLDIIEAHGSNKTDSAPARVLHRTLYALGTQVSIAFGRPHQLPDGKDAPGLSPLSGSVGVDDLSTMVCNMARLQNRLFRDFLSNNRVSTPPDQSIIGASTLPTSSAHWMAGCVQDIRMWRGSWEARVDALFVDPCCSTPGMARDSEQREAFRRYGEFLQCEALLLAKAAADRRDQPLVSDEEELDICTRLLQAVETLHRVAEANSASSGFPSAQALSDAAVFPLTWTRAHSIFTALTVLLQHIQSQSTPEPEHQRLIQAGLDVLVLLGGAGGQSTLGLVNYIQSARSTLHLPGPV